MIEPKLSIDEVMDIIHREFPELELPLILEEITGQGARVSLTPELEHLRPGGTVKGPVIFALIDYAVYLAVLSRIGATTLAVTTSAQMDFMRKPKAGEKLTAEVKLQKLGRSLAVSHVEVTNPGTDGVIAQASLTFSIPPKR